MPKANENSSNQTFFFVSGFSIRCSRHPPHSCLADLPASPPQRSFLDHLLHASSGGGGGKPNNKLAAGGGFSSPADAKSAPRDTSADAPLLLPGAAVAVAAGVGFEPTAAAADGGPGRRARRATVGVAREKRVGYGRKL